MERNVRPTCEIFIDGGVAIICCPKQRSIVARVDIRIEALDQHLDDGGVAVGCCPVQRCITCDTNDVVPKQTFEKNKNNREIVTSLVSFDCVLVQRTLTSLSP